jgi:uncharacterized heparinase superfamily protein
MSPGEIVWRAGAALRETRDRYRFSRGLYPDPAEAGVGAAALPEFRLVGLSKGDWGPAAAASRESGWAKALRARADAIAAGRFSFFDLADRDLGTPIDWNRDHASGRPAPLGFAPAIDYRDFEVTGDCKLVWEPNRHHQLVTLGRAWRATGDDRYVEAASAQLDSWLAQCPFGSGMNWRSPLELAIRLINWTYAVDLMRDSTLLTGERRERVLHSVYLHLWEITRKYSQGSSANNHRIGEAAGVAVAASYFRGFPHADRWREQARRILCEEIESQTYADGCNREQALGYHLFVLQLFLVAGVVVRRSGDDLPSAFWGRVEKMLEFLAALAEGGDALPMFGDCDDGYVLDLGTGPGDARGWLAVGAALFGRADFKRLARDRSEPVAWLLGPAGLASLDRLAPAAPQSLAARSFPDSGYYLLQSGNQERDDRISVLFDCGELGFGSIAAHGHADALSVTVRASGRDVLVDPGTYDYFSFPAWREYFRSTRAHNALVLDGADQSAMLGPFLWGRRARARCVAWRPAAAGGALAVVGEHDGYMRLPDPARHRRTLELGPEARRLAIRDDVIAEGRHDVAIYFQLAEDCVLHGGAGNRFDLELGGARMTLRIDARLTVERFRGSEAPIAGWVSRGYHRKRPSTTLVARGRSEGSVCYECWLEFGPPPGENRGERGGE